MTLKLLKFIRKNQFLLLFIIGILISTLSFSFAYFAAIYEEEVSTEVSITSIVSEKFHFEKGEGVVLNANATNFYQTDISITGTLESSAKYNVSSVGANAKETFYHIYFDIEKNHFEYSVNNTTPELLVTIVDPNGEIINTITNSDGVVMNAVTKNTKVVSETGTVVSKEVTGFDITNYNGYLLIEDYRIHNNDFSTPTEHNWSATLTYLNLESDQVLNEGKVIESELVLTKTKRLTNNQMISGPDFQTLTSNYRESDATKTLHKIEFNNTINTDLYNSAVDSWDVSVAKDESVVAYVVEENSENVMYIEADGNIIANTNQYQMFHSLHDVNSLEFNNVYDTSNVTNMSGMFSDLESIVYLDVTSLDTSLVTNMSGTFAEMKLLETINLDGFKTSNVTDMRTMFYYSPNLKYLDLTSFDTSNVIEMSGMFRYCVSLNLLDVSSFNTSNVTTMDFMFAGIGLTTLDVRSLDTSKVTTMRSMFDNAQKLNYLDVSNFNTSNVTNMDTMFGGMKSLKSIDVSNFDTSKVIDMRSMFSSMDFITTLDLSNFDTSSLINMSYMFSGNQHLTTLDISSFNLDNIGDMSGLFFETNWLEGPLYARTGWEVYLLNERSITNLHEGLSFITKP